MRDILIAPLPFGQPFIVTTDATTLYEDARLIVQPQNAATVAVDFFRANDQHLLAPTVTKAPFALVVRINAPGLRDVLVVGKDARGVPTEYWTLLLPITVTTATPPPPDALVPDVRNMTLAAARAALVSAGFVLGAATYKFNPTVAAGTVAFQIPAGGSTAAYGTVVALIMSGTAPGPPVDPLPPASSVLATYMLAKGWHTFGLPLPHGVAPEGVQVGSLLTQLNRKCRWPDGSLKHGIVTVKAPNDGFYSITAAPMTTGPFTAQVVWPTVTVEFGIGGTSWFATLPPYSPAVWYNAGPNMVEVRNTVTPEAGGKKHPLLEVVFVVRSYADGQHRVDVCIQNVKDVTAGGPVSYLGTVTINGTIEYRTLGVQQHQYFTRERQLFPVNFVDADIVPDMEPFFASGALPRLLPGISNPHPASTGAIFDLFGFGDMTAHMASEGGRNTIGPVTLMDAQYAAHPENQDLRKYLVAQANRSGRWSGHITKANGASVTVAEFPNYWLDGRAGVNPDGPNAWPRTMHEGGPQAGGTDTGYEPIDEAHMPSLNYLPYLLTGEQFHADQMRHWAHFAILMHGGRGQGGVLYDSQIRGWAWGLRAIAQAGAWLPDADSDKVYFAAIAQKNIDALDAMALQKQGGPFNWFLVQHSDDPHTANMKNLVISPWMNGYICWAIDEGVALGYHTTKAAQRRIIDDQVRLMTSEAAGFPRGGSSIGWPHVGIVGQGFHATMAAIWTATKRWHPELEGQPWAGYYGVEARLVLQIGVREGVPRCQELLDWLMAQPDMPGNVLWRSGFAVLP